MLSTPKPRSLLHTREITFHGYAREDGLWDIEGHLKDFKTNPFQTSAKTWQPGEAFHDMWVRVTLDKEFVIKDIEAVMDGQPHAILDPEVGHRVSSWLDPLSPMVDCPYAM